MTRCNDEPAAPRWWTPRRYEPAPTPDGLDRLRAAAAGGDAIAVLRLKLREAYSDPHPVPLPESYDPPPPIEIGVDRSWPTAGPVRVIPGKATRENMLRATRELRAEIGQIGQVMITNDHPLEIDTEFEGRTVRGHTHPTHVTFVHESFAVGRIRSGVYTPSISDLDTMRPHPDDPEAEAAFYAHPAPSEADYVHTVTPAGIPITFAFRPVGPDTCELFYKLPGGRPFRMAARDVDLVAISRAIEGFLLEAGL